MAENEVTKSTENKEPKKKKNKPNFFVRMGRAIAKFWRESLSELKKVVWMSGKDLRKSTMVVVFSVVVLSIAIGLVDYGLTLAIQGIARLFN